jgi:hypothetical protein
MSNAAFICTRCLAPHAGDVDKTFLGHRQFTCAACRQVVRYPLTTTFVVVYWIVIGLSGIGTIATLAQGQLPIPGIFAVLMSVAIAQDFAIKREVAAARSRLAAGGTAGAPPPAPPPAR